jgi:hypothetical protein
MRGQINGKRISEPRAGSASISTRDSAVSGWGDGLLREDGDVKELRITMHRAMTREGDEYLQQVCPYLQSDGMRSQGVVGPDVSRGRGHNRSGIQRWPHLENTVVFNQLGFATRSLNGNACLRR